MLATKKPLLEPGGSILDAPDRCLAYLSISVQDLATLKSRIWTQIQHYTWFLTILLGAGPAAVLSSEFRMPGQRLVLISLSLAGTLMALLAYLIIRKDLHYMNECDARVLHLEAAIGVLQHAPLRDSRRKAGLAHALGGAPSQDPRLRIAWISRWRIRTLILASFLVYMALGIIESLYFLIASSGPESLPE